MSNLVIKTKGMEYASVDRDIQIVLVKYLLHIATDKKVLLSKYIKKLNELFPDAVYLNPKKKNYAPVIWAVKNSIPKLTEAGLIEKIEMEGAMNSYHLYQVKKADVLQGYAKTPYTVIDVSEEELQGWFKSVEEGFNSTSNTLDGTEVSASALF